MDMARSKSRDETGRNRSELKSHKTRAQGEDPVRMAAGTYLVASFVLALLSIVGFIIRWEGLAEWAAYGLGVTLVCGELARIAGRVGPPAQGDISVSVLDANQQFRREHFRQRVALLSIMASAQDPEVRIRAKRELDWADVELFGRVAPETIE